MSTNGLWGKVLADESASSVFSFFYSLSACDSPKGTSICSSEIKEFFFFFFPMTYESFQVNSEIFNPQILVNRKVAAWLGSKSVSFRDTQTHVQILASLFFFFFPVWAWSKCFNLSVHHFPQSVDKIGSIVGTE